MLMKPLYTESKEPAPTGERRGAKDKYLLRKMIIDGKCRRYHCTSYHDYKTLKSALFQSANHYGLKITSEYKNGVLKIWRLAM